MTTFHKDFRYTYKTTYNRKYSQHDQGNCHCCRALMQMMLLLFRTTKLSEECRCVKPEHIISSHHCAEHAKDPVDRVRCPGCGEYLIFREKSAERRNTGNSDTTEQESNVSDR